MISATPANINDPKDFALLLSFRCDGYRDNGIKDIVDELPLAEYEAYLARRVALSPNNVCFLWQDNRLIGCYEAGVVKAKPNIAYLNFIYIMPHFRRTGVGLLAMQHIERYFLSNNFTAARLSSAEENQLTKNFYTRAGWQVLGPRDDKPNMIIWEKQLA